MLLSSISFYSKPGCSVPYPQRRVKRKLCKKYAYFPEFFFFLLYNIVVFQYNLSAITTNKGKGKSMKKALFFVLAGLTILSLPAFGSAIFDIGRSRASSQAATAGGADVAEVPDIDYIPRQNPAVQRAESNVYALPATALKPEAERLPPPVYAISGVRGREINEDQPWEVVDIVVDLPQGESFSRGLIEGYEVNSWILNLPRGLEAKAHGVKRGDTSVKIYVSGTPEVAMREIVTVNIPGNYLRGGADRRFTSPDAAESNTAWEAKQTQNNNQ
jgi:hypothetical protein